MRYLLIAITLIIALWPGTVLAVDDPDTIEIHAVYVFEDLLDIGDIGVLVRGEVAYSGNTTNPIEPITDTYIVSFIDTDGTTQLKAITPYAYSNNTDPYNKNGYGMFLGWIYFTAAEATADNITVGDKSNYQIWIIGNPTVPSGWSSGPPLKKGFIDDWITVGTASSEISHNAPYGILLQAEEIQKAWGITLVTEISGIGRRLTDEGVVYITNVIPFAQNIAPSAFAVTSLKPIYEELDYTTSFGAILTNETGEAIGSPIILTEGSNSVNVTVTGNFTIELNNGTIGTVTTDVGVVTGSPVTLFPGINTIVVTGAGNITIQANLANAQTAIDDTTSGSIFDLSGLATNFGLSNALLSGLVWLLISIVICAYVYKSIGSKPTLLIFQLLIIGGAVLGLMTVLVAALMFIAFGFYTAYILFYKPASF